eukprot:923506-Prorocentrum_minimum.AAC.1
MHAFRADTRVSISLERRSHIDGANRVYTRFVTARNGSRVSGLLSRKRANAYVGGCLHTVGHLTVAGTNVTLCSLLPSLLGALRYVKPFASVVDRLRCLYIVGTTQDWWAPEDAEEFKRRAQVIVDQVCTAQTLKP